MPESTLTRTRLMDSLSQSQSLNRQKVHKIMNFMINTTRRQSFGNEV